MSKPIEALSPTDAAALEDALAGMLDDRYATSAQGAKADTAVQPGALGTAAGQSASAFASAEQGVKADRADGARQTMARRIGLRSKIVGWAVPFYRVLADGSRLIIGGQRDDGVFYAPKGILADPAPSNPRRGSWGIFHIFDRNRVSAFSVMPDRKIRMAAGLEATTLSVVMGQIDAAGGASKARLTGNLPGYNHRASTKAAHIAATMQTWLGPVDVDMPVAGVGNAFAITNLPYVVLSFSGQSNTLAGSKDEDTTGDVITQNDVDFGLLLRGIRDPYRAFRGNVLRYSSSAPGGVAPYYTAGSIGDMQPAGQDAEIFGIYTWLPDLVQFSIIHLDQMMAQSQAVYLQMTSAQGSTPITDYLPGQTRGDNITGFITGAQDVIAAKGKKAIGPAHFMVGHEDASIAPYASYYDALGAMADHVCGKLSALQGNVDAGLSAKLITYQANQSRGAVDGKTFNSGGTLDTHTRSLADNRIANIGGVYDELTADGGIHMRGKFSTALKMAYAFVMWWRFGVRVQAPYIARAIWDGNVTVTCTVEGMAGPLMEDTDWLPAIADGGLFYDDDDAGAPPAITGVNIVNTINSTTSAITRQIVITLASAPTGVLKSLYIGGRNNNALTDWSGGLTSFYVPGIPNFWYDKGFGKFCTPDLRWRLCPAIAMVRRAGFDFSQLVMPAGATLTRGSTGWYRNNAGAVTAAAANVPRFNYRWTGSAWALAGLLVEGAATNAYRYSQDATNAAWSKTDLTAPSADTIVEVSTASVPRNIRQNYNFVAGEAFALSVVGGELPGSAKRYLMLTVPSSVFGTTGNMVAKFDLATGAIVAQNGPITAGIEAAGPGLWRCWITGTPTVTTTTSASIALHDTTNVFVSYSGDGASGIKVSHMQIEAGSRPSSIIPTTAAAVTRAADALTLDWAAGAGLADGAITARYTSGDATVQDVATSVVGGAATVPTNLNRRSVLLVEKL